MRKDKEKVLDEVWTDERVRSFLEVRAHDEVADDFHMLLKAYQSMRAEDFAKFVNYFVGDNRDLSTTNLAGQTVLSIVDGHRKGNDYAEILRRAGASQ